MTAIIKISLTGNDDENSTMMSPNEKVLRDISTKEELITFLQAVYHEREPNLYRCRWAPYNEKEVYLWYKGDCQVVNGSVVEVLRSLPAKRTSLSERIKSFILNLIADDDYA